MFGYGMVAAALFGGLLVLAWSAQRKLLYYPDRTRVAPATIGLPEAREVLLRTPDAVDLVCWYGEAAGRQPTILYFHGNAGNLASRAGRVADFMSRGWGMMMLSYRGYGGSGGKPTESNIIADAKLAYRWLIDHGVSSEDIVLYGESLGTGVAVQLADAKPVAGVILDAPYTSIADVGARIYPYLPVHAFILDRYDSLSRIAKIDAPLLIVHGENDDVIPIEMGEKLFNKALNPKSFARIPDAGHSDHHLFGSYDAIGAWIGERWPAAAHVEKARNP